VSGILDNKSRVLDTILTIEGRKQLSQGGVDIAYVSFSDGATFYAADAASGSQDATQRIYLESCQLPQDQITFQADDTGNVLSFNNSLNLPNAGGKILNYTYTGVSGAFIGGAAQGMNAVRGTDFTDMAHSLLGASPDNFAKLRVISTHDPFFEDDTFLVGPNDITFQINDNRPLNTYQQTMHVTAQDSIFSDPRFNHLPNFKYLPPINKLVDKSALGDYGIVKPAVVSYLGNYAPWGAYTWFWRSVLSLYQIFWELNYYRYLGFSQQIFIDPTSIPNNLVGQFFEINFDSLKKMDIVDYGRWPTGNPAHPTAHTFFIGKVAVDEKGTDTFVHLFTLVFQ